MSIFSSKKIIYFISSALFVLIFSQCRHQNDASDTKAGVSPDRKEYCMDCHQMDPEQNYYNAESKHNYANIKCQQCHDYEVSPSKLSSHISGMDFNYVSDETCAGCHIEQYTQVNSKESTKIVQVRRDLNSRMSRVKQRSATDVRYYIKGKGFVKNQVCVACHFNNHTLSRNPNVMEAVNYKQYGSHIFK